MKKLVFFSLFFLGAFSGVHGLDPALLPVMAQTDSPAAPETKEQTAARMAWWTDARFGMFIHWDMSSVAGTEISWSRGKTKPLDITHDPAGYVEDPVYDNLYKQFDPEKFDAAKWVQIAKDAGMKYIVFTAKHHGGFAMFDTKLTDYSIMHTPFHRDVVKELADACHQAGMRFGIYYSQRDWHHPDYGQGDNSRYLAYMNGQIRELLANYGKVDVIWFDSSGRGDPLTFWKIGDTWALLKSLQPDILINDRLGVLGHPPPAPYNGDFDTPEQKLGSFQNTRPWESCITLSNDGTWSYHPGVQARSLRECIHDIAVCACGDGNILLDVGPDPQGEIPAPEVSRLAEIGAWMKKYGPSIYGTRGGPYLPGSWGGSTYRGNIVYLHVLHWTGDTLHLAPLKQKVTASRVLTGGDAKIVQSDKGVDITLDPAQQAAEDTVIELTLDAPVTHVLTGMSQRSMFEDPQYGSLISADATLTTSSSSPGNDKPGDHPRFFSGPDVGYAFHTDSELNPWAIVDLGKVETIKGIHLENRPGEARNAGLRASLSVDGATWTPVWQSAGVQDVWEFPVTRTLAGAQVPGQSARYIKLDKVTPRPAPLLLKRIEVYGTE